MGGKGKKRREKNYRAAHGDNTRLPPPPVPSSLDALPSKLRQLLALTSPLDDEHKVKREANGGKRPRSEADVNTKKNGIEKAVANVGPVFQNKNRDDEDEHDSADQRNKKRKKMQVNDLRFAAEMEKLGVRSSKRERKKEYFKAKKNKNKNKKDSVEDILYAPKKDIVKFGDIVEAPPKLAIVPKVQVFNIVEAPWVPKKPFDASQERKRLQAVEAYRSRKQWTSRPGVHLPPTIEDS